MSTPIDHDASEKVKPTDHTIGGAETANMPTQIEKIVQTVQDEAPIHKLSDDLLMFLMEMIYPPAKGGPVHGVHLGSVCRRFRDTTLRMPRLWSVIRFSTSVEWTALQLDRSKQVGLKITFNTQTSTKESILSTVLEKAHALSFGKRSSSTTIAGRRYT
jgi:hypothetical protein